MVVVMPRVRTRSERYTVVRMIIEVQERVFIDFQPHFLEFQFVDLVSFSSYS